jgi:hypothetical protein
MEKAGDILKLMIKGKDRKKLQRADLAVQIAENRRNGTQELGFSSRPFTLCGIPYTKPAPDQLSYERRNGKYILRIVADPKFGLPWGMDQAIPYWVATKLVKKFRGGKPLNEITVEDRVITFSNITELLSDLGFAETGWYYKKVQEMFQRIWSAQIQWGTEQTYKDQTVWRGVKFNFFDGIQMTRFHNVGSEQTVFPDLEEPNLVIVSEMFFRECMTAALPFDMEIYRNLHNKPGMLHFFMSLAHRCYNAKGKCGIPLFGPDGLRSQMGLSEALADKSVKLQLKRWLEEVKVYWPECPAYIYQDKLIVDHAVFCTPKMLAS